jgi:TetR/AcrR family transcriptional regulator, copper-responsive repressor
MERGHEKRGRGRPQTLDRQRTVEVAMTSFWCDGVRDVSMNEICRRANVSKPGVYREFGSEDGLTEAAVELYRATVVASVLEVLAIDKPFAEALDGILRFMTEPSGKPAGCLVAELRSAPGGLGPATAAKVSAVAEEMRQAYEQWFRRAQARGEVDGTVSPALAAHFIDTQLTSVLLQMRLRTDPELVRAQAHLAFRALNPRAAGA